MLRHPWLTCLGATALALGFVAAARADDWPQWLGPQRDGVWRETGLIDRFPAEGAKVRWRAKVGAGYAGPAVANGRVYVTDYVLDEGYKFPPSGFSSPPLKGKERTLCLDEKTGNVLWTDAYVCEYKLGYSAGPRTTPTVHGGKVYSLGTMGDLRCLDAATGALAWSKNFMKEYNAPVQTWGFSASPLIDGDRLICLVGGDAAAVAFHKDTGKELWRALPTKAQGYCPPVIYTLGGKRQLVVWTAESVNGLDPETGKSYWAQPFEVKASLTIPTPRQDGDKLFVTSFYNGPIMFQFAANDPKPKILWRGKSNSEQSNRTDGLHSIMVTPYFKDGHLYGVCSYGQLRCLKADSGERLWESFVPTSGNESRWGNAFLVPHEDRTFLFNEKGDLIIAKLTPQGYEEVSRAHLLEPTNQMAGRPVVWSHPAFANRSVYARNDQEIVCVSLAK